MKDERFPWPRDPLVTQHPQLSPQAVNRVGGWLAVELARVQCGSIRRRRRKLEILTDALCMQRCPCQTEW
jgi:hypothetical protein